MRPRHHHRYIGCLTIAKWDSQLGNRETYKPNEEINKKNEKNTKWKDFIYDRSKSKKCFVLVVISEMIKYLNVTFSWFFVAKIFTQRLLIQILLRRMQFNEYKFCYFLSLSLSFSPFLSVGFDRWSAQCLRLKSLRVCDHSRSVSCLLILCLGKVFW